MHAFIHIYIYIYIQTYTHTYRGRYVHMLIHTYIEDNHCSAVYRLASGKKRTKTLITTLRKLDGLLTSETKETLRLMLEYFTPEDNDLDNNHHKRIRELTDKQPNTPDDHEFAR